MRALLKANKELKEGSFLNVRWMQGNIVALEEQTQVGVIYSDKNPFSIPTRTLKARVLKGANGEYEVKILRSADLHMHSGYSLLDGLSKVKKIVEKVDYAAALTDHGVMYGMVDYYQQMTDAGKMPIIGFEAYVTNKDGELTRNHLILLAKNQVGYKNLIKLTSDAYETFYKKPHVTYEQLRKHSNGLIALSGCLAGEIPRALKVKDYNRAKEVAIEFRDIFKDDFYLEIQRHDLVEEEIVNPGLIQLSKELGIKLVATTDSHYINKEDAYAHEVLCCIQTGKTMYDADRFKMEGTGYHIHTPEELEYKFQDIIEAVDNTLEILEKCKDFKMEFGNISMPKYDVPEGFESLDEYLKHLVREGFKERFYGTDKYKDPVYLQRIQYELDVILSMGFSGYFVIVWDFIKFARDNNIAVGPGRGSAVGCLVAYCLKITDLDPIKYNLFFERFLNPERVSMPDMDIDFEYERRQEVIDYVVNKYGVHAVAKIITFGTMAAKMVCRDVARALGYQPWMGDKVAKLIPDELKMTLEKAVETSPELRKAMEESEDIAKIVEVAKQLEGLQRHSSIHACGILIAPGPVSDYLPTALVTDEETQKKELTSQVNMVEAELLGLLKMDFLGLRTMGVLNQLKKWTGEDYSSVSISDPYVYKEISKGETYGVFQLESPGMRNFMVDLFADVSERIAEIENKYGLKGFSNPVGNELNKEGYLNEMTKFGEELFERTIAGVSLYRPGPMDFIPNYVSGMRKPDEIEYLHPLLQPILKETYGCIVYQEQVMKIVQDLAGYSLGRADLMRRAMGKKKMDVMQKEKNNFIFGLPEEGVAGCVKNGVPEEVAVKIWDSMVDFAKYAFNKSHAAAYACIAVRCAYYKTYYPKLFMCEVLNSVIDDSKKLKNYLSAAKKLKLNIVAPNVQVSRASFSVVDEKIVYGFKGLKKINKSAIIIEQEREKNGPFLSLSDFLVRIVKDERIDKGFFEALVFTGALDCFEGNKAAKLELAIKVLEGEKKKQKTVHKEQVGLFDLLSEMAMEDSPIAMDYSLPKTPEFDLDYLLEQEREFAGLYVSGHPSLKFEHVFKSYPILKCEDVESKLKDVVMGGLITKVKLIYTRNNKKMYSLEIEDETESISAIIFPEQVNALKFVPQENDTVLVRGYIQENDFGKQIVVQGMRKLGDFKNYENPDVVVFATDKPEEVDDFGKIAAELQGAVPTGVLLNNKKYRGRCNIQYAPNIVERLESKFPNQIQYRFQL